VYAASCAALASLEYMVHARQLPRDMVLLVIEIPSTLNMTSSSWIPGDADATRQIGDEWLDSMETAVLRVPSVLIPNQMNYLINPKHHLIGSIQIVDRNPFAFDRRIFSSTTGREN
jgi:RES domain-containing protein